MDTLREVKSELTKRNKKSVNYNKMVVDSKGIGKENSISLEMEDEVQSDFFEGEDNIFFKIPITFPSPILVYSKDVKDGSLKEKEMVEKNGDIGDDEQDFDKEALYFNSIEGNVTHDVPVELENSPLKEDPKYLEDRIGEIREREIPIPNTIYVDMKFMKDFLKHIDIQPPLGIIQKTRDISMYTFRVEKWTFISIKMININY